MSGSVQLAVLMPLLLGIIFAVIQTSIWFAGRSSAQQAAMAGAERAALASGLADDAERVSIDIAERGGLQSVGVSVQLQSDLVQVRVTAQVPGPLPGPWTTVEAAAQRMREA
ncbi:TadE/TadG family type IV pilus assembly protein [Brooklawnia sp.]|uniref:TadE/TadG family type IV pilus assembly protein n=1 Tax=Brooklawnia sp. TaxID=2699740 RepID=UPI00311FBDC8